MTDYILNLVDPLLEKLSGWAEQIVLMLPNFLLAVLAVVFFGVLSRFVRKGVVRLFTRITDNQPIANVLGSISRVAVVALGLLVALNVLHLEKTVTSLLAGVGVLGLALGFAFQDTAANFVSGLYMAIRRPIDVGDIIEVAGQLGTVERIELRSTVLKTLDGLSVFIPHKEIFQGVVVNYTRTDERRVEVVVGVSYSEDLEEVRKLTLACVEGIEGLDTSRNVEFFYTEFGDSSINFSLRFWLAVARQPNWLEARSEAIIRIKRTFDEAGISIPFPIRTLDFGARDVGGRQLESLPLSA